MNEQQSYKVDRTGWPSGPWDNEPDRVEWRDDATGLPCLIVRNDGVTGALCGYVGVAPGHPLHGKSYAACALGICGDNKWCEHSAVGMLECHGGVTYADACAGQICHTPAPGESADTWWVGFDCAHAFDVAPAMRTPRRLEGIPLGPAEMELEHYRDVAYVTEQCAALAQQLVNVSLPTRRITLGEG